MSLVLLNLARRAFELFYQSFAAVREPLTLLMSYGFRPVKNRLSTSLAARLYYEMHPNQDVHYLYLIGQRISKRSKLD